jgi:hypothetical protein
MKFKLKFWAEIAGERVESIVDITIPDNGQCRELVKEFILPGFAKVILGGVKTGWEVLP